MAFRTKIDLSNNRQVKQFERTQTVLSGSTSFGLPFSALTSGPDLSVSGETYGVTNTLNYVASTFSGNSGTTVYTWYDPSMQIGYNNLSALTPSNSGDTQYSSGWTGSSVVTIDGNTVNLAYTGVSYDITPIAFYNLGSGNYSGTVETVSLEYYSATTLDYTGRTIWVDVSGITRTERLIVTNEPQIGYVLTCYTSEGMAKWDAVTGVTISGGSILWSAGTGTYSIAAKNHNSTASGDYSIAYGHNTIASNYAAHAEGTSTTASGYGSHAEGGVTIASATFSHAEGNLTKATGDTSHAEGNLTIAGGSYSHAEGYNTQAIGQSSHAEGTETIAIGSNSHAGGNQSTASGTTSFVHGLNSIAGGSATIVLGSSITGTTANTTYVNKLNIKSLGTYADNAAAISAGLEVGTLYKTSTGQLMIVY